MKHSIVFVVLVGMTSAKFKTYSRDQLQLIPQSWEEKINHGHPVRIVDQVVETINLSKLYNSYKGGGTTSHNPKMLLKAVIYAYIRNIYSSRKIEDAIKSDINFIWLCGSCEPDHNTINRFRSQKVAPVLKDIFKQIVLLLADEGLVSLKEVYVDGTKIEANANRYTFVGAMLLRPTKRR